MNASEASCKAKNEQVFPQRNRKYEALHPKEIEENRGKS